MAEQPGVPWPEALVTHVYDPHTVVEVRDGWLSELMVRPCLVLIIPDAGSIEVTTEGSQVTVHPGEIGVTRPKTPARFRLRRPARGGPTRFRWAPVTAQLWGGIDLFALIDPPASLDGDDARAVTAAFDRLAAVAVDRHPFAAPLRRQAVAAELLTILTERSGLRPGATDLFDRARELAPVLRGMHDNLEAHVETADLARMAHLSPASVHRKFGAVFGTSPMAYLKALRLDEGAQQLFRTDDAVADIAHRVGFPNAFHFSREFRARFGVPPSRYRLRSRSAHLPDGEPRDPTAT